MRFFKVVFVASVIGLFGCSNAILSEATRENLAGQKFTNQPKLESLIQASSQLTGPEQQGAITLGVFGSELTSNSFAIGELSHRDWDAYKLVGMRKGTTYTVQLEGPGNADFDLYT